MTPAELLQSADPRDRERGRVTVKARLRLAGWDIDRALHEEIGPVGRPKGAKKRASREGDRLREIADALGLSRERVRQIEVEALRKLRMAFESLGWTAEDVGAWLDAKAGSPDDVPADAMAYMREDVSATHSSRAYRWREEAAEAREAAARAEREADEMAHEIVEVARAHRMIERVCTGMESGGEIGMLREVT